MSLFVSGIATFVQCMGLGVELYEHILIRHHHRRSRCNHLEYGYPYQGRIASKHCNDSLQPFTVCGVEGAEGGAVDIQDSDYCITAEDGDYDLAVRGAAAGDVAGKLMDIRDDYGGFSFPGASADAFSETYPAACDRPLEWAEHKLPGRHVDPVETGPPESELMVEHGGDIGHIGDEVAFIGDQSLYLLE